MGHIVQSPEVKMPRWNAPEFYLLPGENDSPERMRKRLAGRVLGALSWNNFDLFDNQDAFNFIADLANGDVVRTLNRRTLFVILQNQLEFDRARAEQLFAMALNGQASLNDLFEGMEVAGIKRDITNASIEHKRDYLWLSNGVEARIGNVEVPDHRRDLKFEPAVHPVLWDIDTELYERLRAVDSEISTTDLTHQASYIPLEWKDGRPVLTRPNLQDAVGRLDDANVFHPMVII